MHIVGSIISEVLKRQEEDAFSKYYAKVGTKYIAKHTCELALTSMRITGTGGGYGDHHQEADWYNYDDEVIEPVPPLERNVGLKVKKR